MKIDSGLVWAVMGHSTTINELGSYDHGPSHWARVRANGMRIGERTEGCDLVVVDFFALFHDAMRENEFDDPRHGERGAKLALNLGVQEILGVEQFVALWSACFDHDRGTTSEDPTIGVCWDADRLDLGRVGIQPSKRFFSTAAGKEEVDNL